MKSLWQSQSDQMALMQERNFARDDLRNRFSIFVNGEYICSTHKKEWCDRITSDLLIKFPHCAIEVRDA